MRIGIDAHHINGKPQGSRTYLIHLIRALAALAGDDSLWIYSFRPEETRRSLGANGVSHRRIFPQSARLRVPLVVPALEVLDGLSVFHSQYIAPPLSFVPEVVTIHDVLFETHPDLFRGAFSERSVRLIRRSARRARMVLTVSEFSRRELIETYRLEEARVLVTPNGVDPFRFHPRTEGLEPVRTRYGIDGPFLLTVGRIEPRKNLERLIRAFDRARQRLDPGLKLVLAGTADFRHQSVLAEAQSLPRGAVIQLGAVPDEDLPMLYNLAEALAYPSLSEGFGIPLLEAMACGTPALSSPRGALPEVGGDAVLWVDPEDEDALAEGLVRILTDAALRERLRFAGLERAKLFQWSETARRTRDAYRQAVEGAHVRNPR